MQHPIAKWQLGTLRECQWRVIRASPKPGRPLHYISSALHSSLSWQPPELHVDGARGSAFLLYLTKWSMLLGLSGRGAGEGTREMKQACLWHAWATAQSVCLRLEKKYFAQWSCLSLLATFWLSDKNGSTLNSSLFADSMTNWSKHIASFVILDKSLWTYVFSSLEWMRTVIFKWSSSRSYGSIVVPQNLQGQGGREAGECQAQPFHISLLKDYFKMCKAWSYIIISFDLHNFVR